MIFSMMSYKKLCSIFLVITIVISTSQLNASEGVDTSNSYFYNNTDYEGFAGYIAVITPTISNASTSMKKKLHIKEAKPTTSLNKITYVNHKKQQSNQHQTQQQAQQSTNKQFSQIASLAKPRTNKRLNKALQQNEFYQIFNAQ